MYERMKVLREVGARGSFSAAAEALSFTQSADLAARGGARARTGTQLVERGSRGVRMTEAGRVLIEHADAILARIENAEEDLAALAGLRGGRLRLIAFQSGNATLRRARWPPSTSAIPRSSSRMQEAEPDQVAPRLRAGEADLALVYDHPSAPDVLPAAPRAGRHLLDDPYDVILSAGHALAKRRRVSLADLAEDPWIRLGQRLRVSRRSPTAPAARPASSREWPSRPTRPLPRRPWLPRAWA